MTNVKRPIIFLVSAFFMLMLPAAPFGFGDEADGDGPGYKTEDQQLRQEAEEAGIPRDRQLFYETRMRDIERDYETGDLTKTEYIQRKSELESECKGD